MSDTLSYVLARPNDAADRIERLEAALRENDTGLRLLVDIVWQHATESTAVPFHKTSDMLIAKYRANLCEDEGCPNAGTPHVCINRVEPKRQERIEQLEAALRKIAAWPSSCEEARDIARAALTPARQENDDVFPGFRGNNEA